MALRRTHAFIGAPLAVVAALAMAGPAFAAPPPSDPQELRFAPTDADADGLLSWTVPGNICALGLEAAGGNGGHSWTALNGRATVGLGAIITTRVNVTPGQVLTLAVGSAAVDDGSPTNGEPAGGVPGGGSGTALNSGGGGGGWSGVATGTVPDQSNVLLVAGGGGGAGNNDNANGGDAGMAGADGASAVPGGGTVGGGGAGTESAGGASGTIGSGGIVGGPGSALTGGYGVNGGGAGGGGYFGGGGAGVWWGNAAGGGGSSYPFAASPDRLSYAIKSPSDPSDGWLIVRFDPASTADACGAVDGQTASGSALDGATLSAGDGLKITGTGWAIGGSVNVTLGSMLVGTAITAPDGTFSFVGVVPATAASGAQSLRVGPAGGADVRFAVTILASSTVANLPPTGSAINPIVPLAGAGALLLLGTALLLGARLRRPRS